MRLFVGVEIPENIKNYLHNAFQKLKVSEKGWEHFNDYHLTLLFIGKIEENIDPLIERLEKISFKPFEITLEQLVFFPRRVLYLGPKPSQKLLELKDQLEANFPEFRNPHARPFVPHITVKRYQRYEYEELKKRIEANPLEPQTLRVERLSLFKAEKDDQNRKYHIIHRGPRQHN